MAERGIGDVALAEGHWTEAIAQFERALPGAPPFLAAELESKRARAVTERRRFAVEVSGWAAWCAALVWFLAELWRRRRALAWPRETTYLAPIYALLVAASFGQEANVRLTLGIVAAGSLALVTLAFAVPRDRHGLRLWLDGALLALANLGLFYAAMRRSGLLDAMNVTLQEATS